MWFLELCAFNAHESYKRSELAGALNAAIIALPQIWNILTARVEG
jgi:hypothetical protein